MKKLQAIVVKRHENVVVVRDDLFPYGSKARFLDDYFASLDCKEVVFGGSPRWGFAQISLAFLGKRHGKKITVFLPASNELSEYSKRAIALGADIRQVPMGFLAVTQARAREHAAKTGGFLLPLGLGIPEAIEGVCKVVKAAGIEPPDEIWTVASSGTLSRGLQKAFPRAKTMAVQVGHRLSQEHAGRAIIIPHPLAFAKHAKIKPPFPSVPEYDAKAWEFIPKDGKKVRLFWNVGA